MECLLAALNRRGLRRRATERGGTQTRGVLLAYFARKKKRGIDARVVEADRPVQVRAGHPAGSADLADSVAARDTGALRDIDAAQMVVHGDQSLAVVEEHGEPVEEIIADLDHGARCGSGEPTTACQASPTRATSTRWPSNTTWGAGPGARPTQTIATPPGTGAVRGKSPCAADTAAVSARPVAISPRKCRVPISFLWLTTRYFPPISDFANS